jgi:hypothetical protein
MGMDTASIIGIVVIAINALALIGFSIRFYQSRSLYYIAFILASVLFIVDWVLHLALFQGDGDAGGKFTAYVMATLAMYILFQAVFHMLVVWTESLNEAALPSPRKRRFTVIVYRVLTILFTATVLAQITVTGLRMFKAANTNNGMLQNVSDLADIINIGAFGICLFGQIFLLLWLYTDIRLVVDTAFEQKKQQMVVISVLSLLLCLTMVPFYIGQVGLVVFYAAAIWRKDDIVGFKNKPFVLPKHSSLTSLVSTGKA